MCKHYPLAANNTLSDCGREGVFTTGIAKPAILDNIFVQNTASGLVIAGHSQGEVLQNVFQRNPLGIAISDFAAPAIANNKLSENRTAIALSRNAQPVLRQNLIAKNTQGGLLVNGNAVPDLGNTEDNATTQKLVFVGNQLNPSLVKGLVELISTNRVAVSTSFSDASTESLSQINYPKKKALAPSHSATRAEVAAMVYQALVAIGRTSAIKSVYVGLHSRS